MAWCHTHILVSHHIGMITYWHGRIMKYWHKVQWHHMKSCLHHGIMTWSFNAVTYWYDVSVMIYCCSDILAYHYILTYQHVDQSTILMSFLSLQWLTDIYNIPAMLLSGCSHIYWLLYWCIDIGILIYWHIDILAYWHIDILVY